MSLDFPVRLGRVTRRLAPEARRHRRYLLAGLAGTLVVVFCRLAYAWPLRGVLDQAFHQTKHGFVDALVPSSGDPVLWLSGAFLLIVAMQGMAEFVQRVSYARFSIALSRDLRAEALATLARGPTPSTKDGGDAISRVIGDTSRFKSGVKGVLIRFTQNGTFFVGVFVMLTIMDARLGLVFLAGGLVLVAIAAWGASRVNRVAQRLRKKEGRLAAHIHSALMHDVRRLAEGDDAGRRAAGADAKTAQMEQQAVLAVHVVLGLTICAVLSLGLHDVHAGRLAPGDLFTVLFYLLQVHNPTVKLGRSAMRLGRVLASAERLVGLIDRRPAPTAQLQFDLEPVPEPVPEPEPALAARSVPAPLRVPDGLFAHWADSR
jgi:ATP-binding cassette subfamily B protein